MTRARFGWIAAIVTASVMLMIGVGLDRVREGPTRLLAEAQADYQAGLYEASAAKLERLARLRSPTPMDRMARALVARARGADALSELAQVPDDHVLSSQAHLLAGQIEAANGRLRLAENHFRATLAREPKNVHAHRELAALYNVQGRLHEMDEHMEALSDLNAIGFDHLVHWGTTKSFIWDPVRDCEALAKSLEVDPDDRHTRLALFDGLRRLGHQKEAASVLSYLPDTDCEARVRRAILALDMGETQRADELLSGGPADDSTLANARGQLALSRHDPASAVRYLRIALASHPDDVSVISAMGTALQAVGQGAEARTYLEARRRHTDVTPLIVQATTSTGRNDPTLPVRLGVACEAAGRFAEARAWYRQAIVRDPLDSRAQEGLFRLRRGPSGRAQPADANVGGPVGAAAEDARGR
jgi:Flp pilus assembly protein TadD